MAHPLSGSAAQTPRHAPWAPDAIEQWGQLFQLRYPRTCTRRASEFAPVRRYSKTGAPAITSGERVRPPPMCYVRGFSLSPVRPRGSPLCRAVDCAEIWGGFYLCSQSGHRQAPDVSAAEVFSLVLFGRGSTRPAFRDACSCTGRGAAEDRRRHFRRPRDAPARDPIAPATSADCVFILRR